MVDITQDGNNSSRNSRPSSNLNTQAHRLQNVVIDIESEDLTFNQARAIRQQIQKDVEQLQNRVRMLQQEEQRAMKKIAETRKKTQSIRDLQEKNDEKFKMMLIE
jgi:Mg2+ and Co2+ transporter CorA